jgi:predicted Zn-dependent peptidase
MWDRSKQSSLFTIWTVGFQNPDLVRDSVQKIVEETQGSKPISDSELASVKEELRTTWMAELQSAQGVADAFTEAIAMGYANDVNAKFHAIRELCSHDLTIASKNWLIETGTTIGLMFPYKVADEKPSLFNVPKLVSVGSNLSGNIVNPPLQSSYINFGDTNHFASGETGQSLVTSGTFWKRKGLVHVSVTFTPGVDTEWFSYAMGSIMKDPHVQWKALNPGSVMLVLMAQPEKMNCKLLDKIWGDSREYSIASQRGRSMQQGVSYDVNKYSEKLLTEAIFEVPKYKHSLKQAVSIVKNSPRKVVAVAPNQDILNIIRDYFKHKDKYVEYVPIPNCKPKSVAIQQNKTSIKVRYGQAIPHLSREHKDFIPLNIASAILGYGFHGLLMSRVRMADGLTYGIESHISPGALNISATFPPRNLDKGVKDIQTVLAGWRNGITRKEVNIQKQRLKLMPITLADNAAVYVKTHHTFLNEKLIDACTYEDVLQAFDTHIDIHNLTEVRVG